MHFLIENSQFHAGMNEGCWSSTAARSARQMSAFSNENRPKYAAISAQRG
jgi:hypothetical protein